MQGLQVHITGIVQGVGFRPFVYNLATRLQLKGWVRNTSAGVDIEVDGEQDILDAFVKALRDEAPQLSHIDELTASFRAANGFRSFEIIHSESVEGAFQPISPDVPFVTIACVNSSTRMTGVIAIRSLIAPIAGRVLRLLKTFRMIGQRQPWRDLNCVPIVKGNIPIQPTEDSMRSRLPAQLVGQKSGLN